MSGVVVWEPHGCTGQPSSGRRHTVWMCDECGSRWEYTPSLAGWYWNRISWKNAQGLEYGDPGEIPLLPAYDPQKQTVNPLTSWAIVLGRLMIIVVVIVATIWAATLLAPHVVEVTGHGMRSLLKH